MSDTENPATEPPGRSGASNGSAPPPPDGFASSGPASPPEGPSAHEPRPGPAGDAASVETWVPAWPKRVLRWVRFAALVAPLLFLASWSYAAPSRSLCGGCHTVEAAATSAADSVHSEVPCLSCHHRSGLLGAVTYYPTLIRETVHEATGLPVAGNVLAPKPCRTCHEQVADSEGHRNLAGECLDCHGGVAHPELSGGIGDDAHPPNYFLTHGRDSVSQSISCSDCHETTFCRACHAQVAFPHPETWIAEHGGLTIEKGTASCDSCHPTSFCAGCHGTEIPHSDNWLGEHNLADPAVVPGCTTCHVESECLVCHAQHGVHRDQRWYDLEGSR